MASIFDTARETRTLAKPRSARGPSYPLLYTTELLPTNIHKAARLAFQEFCCKTQAGRPRAFHSWTKDGECLFCRFYSPEMDRPVGEMAH